MDANKPITMADQIARWEQDKAEWDALGTACCASIPADIAGWTEARKQVRHYDRLIRIARGETPFVDAMFEILGSPTRRRR